MQKLTGFDDLIAAARVLHHDEEPLTIDAANLAGRPCHLRCSACDGADVLHHWIDCCSDEGDPIQVCKHCPAWREYPMMMTLTPNPRTRHKLAVIAGVALFLSVTAYSCSIYYAEEARQETERMRICFTGGGKWTTAWNWKTYCNAPST